MIKKIKLYIEDYLKYSIGYIQIGLQIDNPIFWIIIEFIATIQRIAMIFLFEVVLQILQQRRNIQILYNSDYTLFKLISKVFVPTIFMAEMFSINQIIAFQIIMIIFLIFPLISIAIFIEYEKQKFSSIQFKSQIDENENTTFSINILNRSYNMSNFIENFLYQQLMGNDQRSWLNVIRNFLAKLLNTYPHIVTIPLMYWNLLVLLLVVYDPTIVGQQQAFLIVLNFITFIAMIILWMFSMIAQRSYSINDNNHLRIVQSFWFNLSQIVKFVPIVIQFLYFLYSETIYDKNVSVLITSMIELNVIGDILDFFISIPYMLEYKQVISFFCLTSTLIISIAHELDLNQISLFSISLISIPISTKMLKVIFKYTLEKIFEKQFFQEKYKQKIEKQQSKRRSKIYEEDLQPFVIEKEIQELKIQQLDALKNQKFKYFVHYLRYISFLRLFDQQFIDNSSDVNNIQKSEFLINIIVLIKSHVNNCTSVFCYCKGYRGEKRQIIDSNKQTIEMKIFNSITINNISISTELIERYIRNFAKYVFDIENNEKQPNIYKLSQLFLYLCESEECYQILVLIMNYKSKNSKNFNMLTEITFTLILNLAKYKILRKMKYNMIQGEIETGIKYKNYRITEIRKDQLLTHILKCLELKSKLMKDLLELKLTFSNFYDLIKEQTILNSQILSEVQTFFKYSNCRTSLLIYMFFTLEIICDFETFSRLKNQLKTKNYKFFEYPNISSNPSQIQGFKVLYLKTNLARHSVNGKYLRGVIMDFSNNAPLMLGYNYNEFKEQITTVHQLVTANLAHYHDQLLEIFFVTNKPQVIRKRRPLLMQKKNKELVFCEMYLDLSFNITEDAFPIYCFLKQIIPFGKYENVKGHIVISDDNKIEGMSKEAQEQLKLKQKNSYINSKIYELVPQFQMYIDELQKKYEQFKLEEEEKEQKGSCSSKFNYINEESLLHHFRIEVEQVIFTIKRHDFQEIYSSNCNITLSVGNIHSRVYQAYLIAIQKIQLCDGSTSQQFQEMIPIQHSTGDSLNPPLLDSIQGIVQVSESLDEESESSMIQSIKSEKLFSEDNLKMSNYELPQMYSNFQSPLPSSRGILTPRDQEIQIINQQESYQFELQRQQTQLRRRTQIKQQAFYETQTKHKKLSMEEIDNQESENEIFYKNENDSTKQNQNISISNIIIKSSLYQKFSLKNNNPKLIYIILGLDILNFVIIMAMTQAFYFIYQNSMNSNEQLITIFQAFSTVNYQLNTMLGLGQLLNQNDIILQEELQNQIKSNIDLRSETFDQLLMNEKILEIMTSNNISIYDYYNQTFVNMSAWSEASIINYYFTNIRNFNSNNVSQINTTKLTFQILLPTFFNHINQYESMTHDIYNLLYSNYLTIIEDIQSIISTSVLSAEIIIIIIYIILFTQVIRLQRRILRSSEQISNKSIENERIRCQNLLTNYKQANEINLYKYQFNFKDKLRFSLDDNSNQKGSQHTKKEQKKQLEIQDELYSCQNHKYMLLTAIGIIICCFYLSYSLIINYQQIYNLTDRLSQQNIYLNYHQEFTEISYVNYILQNYKILQEDLNLNDELIQQYVDQRIEAYGEFIEFDQEFKYGYGDTSVNLLDQLVQNVCLVVNNTICSTIINGKLTQGVLYAIQYYINIVRDDMNQNIDDEVINTLQREDLIAINFISQGLHLINEESKLTLLDLSNQYKDSTQIFFILQQVITFFIFLFQIIILQYCLKTQFFICRQLIHILPPQALYGEDSYQKSLQYIEKIYHNIIQ